MADRKFSQFASSTPAAGSQLVGLNALGENAIFGVEAVAASELTGWRDNFASLTAAATGAGTPSLASFGPTGNIRQRAFGVGDSVYIVWHIDHDIKPDSTCYMHVHWSSSGTSTNPVRWQISYTTAQRDSMTSADNFPAEQSVTITDATDGTAWRHMVSEDAVGMTIPTVDSLIIAEVKRIANGGTENPNTIFGLFVDIHYQTDRHATPNRAPDFYG